MNEKVTGILGRDFKICNVAKMEWGRLEGRQRDTERNFMKLHSMNLIPANRLISDIFTTSLMTSKSGLIHSKKACDFNTQLADDSKVKADSN